MRKAFVLVLTMILMMTLAIPAFAVASPVGDGGLPFLVYATSEEYELVPTWKAKEKLTAEEQEILAQAKEDLKEAVPEGMRARYFFFFRTNRTCDAVFNIPGYSNIVFKQFVDGEWVELKSEIDENGYFVVKDVVNAPMAIFL